MKDENRLASGETYVRGLRRPHMMNATTSLTPYGASFWALILAACGGGGGGGGGSSPVVSNPPRDPVDDGGSTPVSSNPPHDPVDDGGSTPVVSNPPHDPVDDGGSTPVSSNPPPTSGRMSLSGKVIDGPVEGASLFLLRPVGINEGPVKVYVGTSRRDGTYEVSTERRFADYILYADLANAVDHGEDLTSDRDNISYGAGDYWRAPSGSAIISPLTEILGRIYGFRPTPAQKAAFSEHLGLPTTIDVTRDDPLSADMAPYRQQLFLLGQTANQVLQRWGDAPLNAGQTGQAYIDEINRLYAQKTQTPDKEPPSPEQPQQVTPAQLPPTENNKPGAVAINRSTYELDVGSVHFAALARITIIDDGLGTVGLAALAPDSLFEYRAVMDSSGAVQRGIYDLYLKRSVTLDQSKVGSHSVTIEATGNGTGEDPAPVTFTLTVLDILTHDPVLVVRGTARLDEGRLNADTDTGLTFSVTDADSGETGYVAPTVTVSGGDDRFKIVGNRIVAINGESFTSGEAITLTLTATDGNNSSRTDAETIRFTVRDVEHDPVLALHGTARLDEGTLSVDTDTGLTFSATDDDSGETGYVAPRFTLSGDDRFKIVDNRIVAIKGKSFTSGEVITLTLTATDGNNSSRSDAETIRFTIGDVEHPPTLTITRPASQTQVSETIGDDVTGRIDTGIAVVARDADNNLGPLVIESWQGGRWITDTRFAVTDDKLFVKAGQRFDYEDADNPNGVIPLRITATDGTTTVRETTTLQLTNANDPTTGAVGIAGASGAALADDVHTDTPLHAQQISQIADPDDIRNISYIWRDEDGNQVGTGIAFTPTSAGSYQAVAIVIDSLGNRQEIASDPVTVTAPPPAPPAPTPPAPPTPAPPTPKPTPAPTTSNVAHSIHENHPLTKPVIDLDGAGMFAMAPTARAPDNQFFRVDARTGKIWFVPLDANGNGRVDAGDYPLLDAEDHRDVGGDGTYDLQIIRTAPDGSIETIDLALTVQDLELERTWATRRTVQNERHWFTAAEFEQALARRPDLSDAEKAYMKLLSMGFAWSMPETGPLIITWSLARSDSPGLPPGTTVNDEHFDRYHALAERAMRALEAVANVKFIEVADNDQSIGLMRVLVSPNEKPSGGRHGISLNSDSPLSIYIHEIGHYLALDHPFYDDLSPTDLFPKDMTEYETLNSIMGYGDAAKRTITQNDINIIQFLYGAPGTNFDGLENLLRSLTPTPAPTTSNVAHSIHENHPLTKPVIDLDGAGMFAMAPTARSPDNQFFRVDARTGKIWFVPLDANGNGRVDAGDYPLLDAEDHRDQGGDGIYDLQIIRTARDGTTQTIDLALTVQDLELERTWATRRMVKNDEYWFTAAEFEQALARRPDLSDAEKAYMKLLAQGFAWSMPDTGPLIITWSLARSDSPGLRPSMGINDEHFDRYHALAERAMRAWEAVANIKFIEVADNDHSIGLMRVFVFPNARPMGEKGGISLNSDSSLSTYIHEIGHYLTLDHPFYETNAPDLFPKDMTEYETLNSIMTYGDVAKRTITQNDINIIQFLYGAPGTNFDGLENLLRSLTPTPAPTTSNVAHSIHENHPLTKPVIDLDGAGVFAMAPTARAPDNQFFRVDARTGKIWFEPVDANGNGRVDAGDYPLLDAEDHRDQGGDGTYDLQIIRTARDGTTETIDLALTVQDLELEPTWATRKTVKNYKYWITAAQFEQALARRPDLSDAEKAYMKLLSMGFAWSMPETGPLIITWSLARSDSPGLRPGMHINDAHFDRYHALAERAMRAWEAVANVKFIEVADNDHSIGLMRVLVFPSIAQPSSSNNSINMSSNSPLSTYIHEIGHHLALDHPFYDLKTIPDLFPKDLTELHTLNSIMTYGDKAKLTITQNDINIIQFLYGAPGTDFDGLESLLRSLTPSPASTTSNVAHSIHENHPLTKPVIDLDGAGVFAMAPTARAPDNQFFRVDARTGKIWFEPVDANGNGRVDAGDYPLLDAEDHRDSGGNGTYDLQIIRTAPDGTTETIDLALTVQDLELEPTWATRRTVKNDKYWFTAAEFEQALARRPDLSDAEKAYMKLLSMGDAWSMPDTGPLIITWSLMRSDSPGLRPGIDINDAHFDRYHALTERAMRAWEAVANIKFIEVADNDHSIGLMRVLVSSDARPMGTDSSISLNSDSPLSIYIHEIGHYLALDHPFYDTGSPDDLFPKDMTEYETLNSIMGYGDVAKRTITQNDINIIQFLYGAPGTDFDGMESLLLALQNDVV